MKRSVITLRNGVEVLETTGDQDALEHGGGLIWRCPRYGDVFWTFWDARPPGTRNFEVFEAEIPADIVKHFDPDVEELCMVTGYSKSQVHVMGRSKDPTQRAEIVQAMAQCFGASSVSSRDGASICSPFEMVEKWGDAFGVEQKRVSMFQEDDYLIREGDMSAYECGRFDGKSLGRFDAFEDALGAIARDMKVEGASVFFEHEFGDIETVEWSFHESLKRPLGLSRRTSPSAKWRTLVKEYRRRWMNRDDSHGILSSAKGASAHRKRLMKKFDRDSRVQRARAIRKGKIQ